MASDRARSRSKFVNLLDALQQKSSAGVIEIMVELSSGMKHYTDLHRGCGEAVELLQNADVCAFQARDVEIRSTFGVAKWDDTKIFDGEEELQAAILALRNLDTEMHVALQVMALAKEVTVMACKTADVNSDAMSFAALVDKIGELKNLSKSITSMTPDLVRQVAQPF